MQATLPGMSVRGWGGAVGAAAGIAAGAGAAQAGLGYGLGVIVWLPSPGDSAEAAWVASLTWAIWIAATSTVAGALGAARLTAGATLAANGALAMEGALAVKGATDRDRFTATDPSPVTDEAAGTRSTARPAHGWLWRCAVAATAAVGGSLSVALIAVPAREAAGVTAGPGSQPAAAGYALAGIVLGLLLAIWALSSPAVARNLMATIVWLWALAVTTVVTAAVTGRLPTGAPLGSWPDWAGASALWFRGYVFWPAALLSFGSALVIGALAAWSLARRPQLRVGATISGGVGPALVAAARLIAPAPDGVTPEQISAHLAAPYAVIAGLAGSALAAGFAQRRAARTGDAPHATDATRTITGPTRTTDDAAQAGDPEPPSGTPADGPVPDRGEEQSGNRGEDAGEDEGAEQGADRAAGPRTSGSKATGPRTSGSKSSGSKSARSRSTGPGAPGAVPDQRSAPDGPD